MGLYNLQNICKILTPLFTLASSIDIHNLKSSFDPKHLWNHRISLSMGRKKKKEKAKRVGLFLSWSSKIRKISYFPFVQREKRNYTRTQDSKYFCYFLVYNLYIYICLSFHGEEYFFSNVSLSPLLRSILLAFKTARNAFIRVTRGLERTAPSSGVSENSPSSLLAIKPGGLESSHRANQRAIMLFFPLQVAPSALGSSNEGSKLVLINLVTPKELEIRLFGLERISRIFMNDKIKIESNNDLELLTNK